MRASMRTGSSGAWVPARTDAVPQPPTSETEELIEIVFQQWFLLSDAQRRAEPVVVESPKPLRWRGRTGPTLTMTEETARTKLNNAVSIPRYRIEPVSDVDSPWSRVLGPESESDRVFRVTRSVGFDELNVASNLVILRRLGGQWVVRNILPD